MGTGLCIEALVSSMCQNGLVNPEHFELLSSVCSLSPMSSSPPFAGITAHLTKHDLFHPFVADLSPSANLDLSVRRAQAISECYSEKSM